MLKHVTRAGTYAKLSLPLILITLGLYVVGVSVWDSSARLRGTEHAAGWLAGLVTVVLAIAAGLGWALHDRRVRLIELSEMFASVHAEVTSSDILRLIAQGADRSDEVDKQVLEQTYLRNSVRLRVIKTYEAAIMEAARLEVGDAVPVDPFQRLFKEVSESLNRLEAVIEDDNPTVAAQKAENAQTFWRGRAKDPTVQEVYRELAASLAGRSVEPRGTEVTVGDLPYGWVRLSAEEQGVELSNRNAAGEPVNRVWIAGNGRGELLSSGTEHRDRLDAQGKKLPCDLSRAKTRAGIVRHAQTLAAPREVDGRALRDALVGYFRSIDGFDVETSCPDCLRLAAMNVERRQTSKE